MDCLCSENKGADQLRNYAKIGFSHDAAQLVLFSFNFSRVDFILYFREKKMQLDVQYFVLDCCPVDHLMLFVHTKPYCEYIFSDDGLSDTVIIIIAVAAGVILIAIIAIVVLVCRKRNKVGIIIIEFISTEHVFGITDQDRHK